MTADPSLAPEWWHEPWKPSCRYSFPTGIPGLRAGIEDNDTEGYHLFVQEWRGEGKPRGGSANRHLWIDLRAPEPMHFTDREVARAEGRKFAASIREASLHQWIATPLSPLPERVETLMHAGGAHQAFILRHACGQYVVRYFIHEAVCTRPDGTLCEWDWCRIQFDPVTFARDLNSARRIARLELDDLAPARPPNPHHHAVRHY